MFKRIATLVVLAGTLSLAGCASGSKYRGLDAAGVYRLALEEYERGDYGDAAETLDRLLLAYPTFEQAPEAYFLLGEAYFHDEQYITSAAEYARFLSRYPAHRNAPSAALGECRSYASLSPIPQRDQAYTEQALAVCRNVVADYPGFPEAVEAAGVADAMRDKLAQKVYENGHYYLRREFYDSSIIYFEQVVENYPESVWAPRSLLAIIQAYEAIGYEDEVAAARDRLLTQYPDSTEARSIRTADDSGTPGSVPS
ncbi:MAG TPA: outer membrane protein assembly factor BamD [Longimicrobiales bacterium]|nr:outer membrane protein assembly factor BamD [Longimicrobiales bacterium]